MPAMNNNAILMGFECPSLSSLVCRSVLSCRSVRESAAPLRLFSILSSLARLSHPASTTITGLLPSFLRFTEVLIVALPLRKL